MLSVVLYGRNDSHGYNLHKRAAISLNAIAELLDDPDDEILFVDYNTPDDLPTFPEAISDTLTAKAVERLKIIRVRPRVHSERYAARTHLQALEPIARNVAIRRSNPNNRWVLSTNTDMIFCPRQDGRSLSDIVGGLQDGFYHLPRFELPEGLWEALDRKDAAGIVRSAREWGERYHLNEIVYADRDNVYDAPGDFQLFLRQDLFDIDGFHEEMILGWHLDANMAKRMRLLRGKVSSALDHLIGYHCDHTRQATPYHRADRMENDQVRFDDLVDSPQIPEQRDAWGLPDEVMETFQLGQGSHDRYLDALDAVVSGRLTGFPESNYKRDDFGRVDYSADHVLSYLLDIVACMPRETRIAYAGVRPDTLAKFAAGWAAMGGAPVRVLDEAPWLPAASAGVQPKAMADWLVDADQFLFEIGAAGAVRQVELTDEDRARLWVVDRAFGQAAEQETARQAAGAAPRRVIVINGVHNFFEPRVASAAAMTLTPYSSRVRHGYFADRIGRRRAAASEPAREVMDALGLIDPPWPQELERMGEILARLGEAPEDSAPWLEAGRIGSELAACVVGGLVAPGPRGPGVLSPLERARPSRRIEAALPILHPEAGRDAISRLVRLEDWEDPHWRAVGQQLFANRDYVSLLDRDDWVWERVSLATNLALAFAPETRAKVLVAARQTEVLAFALAGMGYEVDIADPTLLATGELKAADWRADMAADGWVSPEPVRLIDERAAAISEGFRYDAVLVPQNGLFANGRIATVPMLGALSKLLKDGGHLGLAVLAQPSPLDSRLQEHALPPVMLVGNAFVRAIGAYTDLQPAAALDARVTPRTFDRIAVSDQDRPTPQALLHGAWPELEAKAVLAFRREPRDWDIGALTTAMADGALIHEAVVAPAQAAFSLFNPEDLVKLPRSQAEAEPGNMFDLLQPFFGLGRTPVALKVPADFGARVAAAAALGRLEVGNHGLTLEIRVTDLAQPGAILVVGVVCDGVMAAEQTLEADGPGFQRLTVEFDIGPDGVSSTAVVVKSLGVAGFDITSLILH